MEWPNLPSHSDKEVLCTAFFERKVVDFARLKHKLRHIFRSRFAEQGLNFVDIPLNSYQLILGRLTWNIMPIDYRLSVHRRVCRV